MTAMSQRLEDIATRIAERFGTRLVRVPSTCGELTCEVGKSDLREICLALRDEADFRLETLVDLCGIDYLLHGRDEWQTEEATRTGFSRAAVRETIVPQPDEEYEPRRFAVVYHLLSVSRNWRLRLRCFPGGNPPVVPSVVDIWQSANWYEREAFDLFGILFDGHPDLRRILTWEGFPGHPLLKDFKVDNEDSSWEIPEQTDQEIIDLLQRD
jgi:NADH-quinone oxidoreductase subunit C